MATEAPEQFLTARVSLMGREFPVLVVMQGSEAYREMQGLVNDLPDGCTPLKVTDASDGDDTHLGPALEMAAGMGVGLALFIEGMPEPSPQFIPPETVVAWLDAPRIMGAG